jgi:DNA-directed RNA polymerase II subunit RPB1
MRLLNFERYKSVTNVDSPDVSHMKFEKIGEWVLDTDGSNLISILSNPNVDKTRTVSNDIFEIMNVLGIEAARTALENEIMEVIKGSSVNYRHLSILVDTMTHKGNLMSIDRHGINRGDVGPLAKSSFEETTDMLINASIFSDYDRINGVSANIMLGQLPPCGTGDSDILLDESLYIQLMKQFGRKRKQKEFEEDEDDHKKVDIDPCSQSCLSIPVDNLPKQHVSRDWLNRLQSDF